MYLILKSLLFLKAIGQVKNTSTFFWVVRDPTFCVPDKRYENLIIPASD